MARELPADVVTQLDSDHVYAIYMAKLEFEAPVYVHTGIGNVTYDGDEYLGVGTFGGIDGVRESELLGPSSIRLTLSGIDPNMIAEALDAGRYDDRMTVWQALRQDDGTLIDDPYTFWRGRFEYANITVGEDNTITIIGQHDLAILDKKDGRRFSDEDQQAAYAGDLLFEYIAEQENVTYKWGGRIVTNGPGSPDKSEGDHHAR